MKKTNFSIALFFLGSILHAQSWVKVADFPADARDDGACFTIKNTAYCGGGVKPIEYLRDYYAFDLLSESWSQIASMPPGQERQYASAFSSDSLGYIFGGYASVFLNDLWQYDPQTDSWTQKTTLPSTPRSGAASFVIDSIAYILGGKNQNNQALDEVWAYDMSQDSWQQKQNLPFGPRWRSGACAMNGKGYLAFGLDDTLLYTNGIYEYDPQADSWAILATHPQGGRNYPKLYGVGNKLYSVGGNDSSLNFLNEVWEYDLSSQKWQSLPAIPGEGRRGGMSFQSATALYYTTGLADSSERLVETLKLVDPTYLSENEKQKGFSLYPNPVQEYFQLDLSMLDLKEGNLRVYSADGSLQLEQQILSKEEARINCQTWPKGIYLVQLKSGDLFISKKLIKL
ncbi:MAG: kelch repeat-containing protein [Vicingaceae bacterium]